MTDYNFKVDHANLQDRKATREFAERMNFDNKKASQPSTRDKSLKKMFNSPAIMASENSATILSSDPDELCDKLKLLMQGKQSGNDSHIINNEIVAILDKLLEYKRTSRKKQKQILITGKLLHTKKK